MRGNPIDSGDKCQGSYVVILSQLVELGHTVRTCFEAKTGVERRLWWAMIASRRPLGFCRKAFSDFRSVWNRLGGVAALPGKIFIAFEDRLKTSQKLLGSFWKRLEDSVVAQSNQSWTPQ